RRHFAGRSCFRESVASRAVISSGSSPPPRYCFCRGRAANATDGKGASLAASRLAAAAVQASSQAYWPVRLMPPSGGQTWKPPGALSKSPCRPILAEQAAPCLTVLFPGDADSCRSDLDLHAVEAAQEGNERFGIVSCKHAADGESAE